MSVLTPPAPAGVVTPPPTGAPVLGPRPWRCTPDEFERFVEAGFFTGSQYQLIRGEIVDMGKEGPRHFALTLVLMDALREAFGAGYHVRPAGPLRIDDSRPEPDAAVVPGSARDYIGNHPATALLAVEISETSLQYDMTTKAELYATAGIPEYWVLDLEGKVLHVYREPQPLAEALAATAYRVHTEHRPGESVQPLHAPNAVAVAALFE